MGHHPLEDAAEREAVQKPPGHVPRPPHALNAVHEGVRGARRLEMPEAEQGHARAEHVHAVVVGRGAELGGGVQRPDRAAVQGHRALALPPAQGHRRRAKHRHPQVPELQLPPVARADERVEGVEVPVDDALLLQRRHGLEQRDGPPGPLRRVWGIGLQARPQVRRAPLHEDVDGVLRPGARVAGPLLPAVAVLHDGGVVQSGMQAGLVADLYKRRSRR